MRFVKNSATEEGKKPRGVRMLKRGEVVADTVVLEVPEHKKVIFKANKYFKNEANDYATPSKDLKMEDRKSVV